MREADQQGVTYPLVYAWGNNPRRALFKGRRCRIICTGALGSALIEFEDGERTVSSRQAVRRDDGQSRLPGL